MTSNDVVVVPTGTANLASVLAGLERVGARPKVSESAGEVDAAARLVLPGVGTLAAAMDRLEAEELVEPLRARVEAGRPTLAICLGMQILCQESEESPGRAGLGLIPGRVTRFRGPLPVPQLGWNQIEPDSGCQLLRPGYVYFANSYRLPAEPEGWAVAMADYDGRFVAAIERGPVLACQFHPELSGEVGLELLGRWLEVSADETGGAPC